MISLKGAAASDPTDGGRPCSMKSRSDDSEVLFFFDLTVAIGALNAAPTPFEWSCNSLVPSAILSCR